MVGWQARDNFRSLAAQRDQPEDSGQRAGHGKIWSEIDTDEDRARNMLRDLCGVAGGGGDQPLRQVASKRPLAQNPCLNPSEMPVLLGSPSFQLRMTFAEIDLSPSMLKVRPVAI